MFQQSTTPEDVQAAPLHAVVETKDAATPGGGDPFLEHYFKRIDPHLAASFTDEQCDAIKTMFGGRGVARHSLEVRRSLPIGRGRYYLVLLMGRESRTFDRLYSEGGVSGAFNLLGYAITATLWLLPAAAAALLLQALL
jgi:hypothetical protein